MTNPTSEEQRIAVCKTSLNQINLMLRGSPESWRNYIPLGRSIIAHIDATTLMQQPERTTEQAWMIAGLQRLAFADQDNSSVNDIATWCTSKWQAIYQREPTNVAAMRGIGQSWLSRAAPSLARINQSYSNISTNSRTAPPIASSEDENLTVAQLTDAERRVGLADYVEARGYLQAASEYLERAVAAAPAQRVLSGDLLVTAAEAYLSLGKVSSPRINERYFRRALQLLGAAAAIRGFTLSPDLQSFLDEYQWLVE
ncbi:hypothetical protein KC367_g4165 [Hortaea werneckii]|nr:hypothetical protein KC342_g17689 [Hortaea werneckii]KAI7057531.1 hypothetical protein KC339_g17893 [Hortaea werneckii]KAI7206895.1 hypothetical protein KC365_g16885 [Hortaea werneckii]KAI7290287.1 hypothetical protein KC340_g17449 [Hortaea werneckii]KAI7312122.1 hypothetical protein KC315_g12100 [Hortaea werneckii]